MDAQRILEMIPGESKYIDALNASMHYVELGSGDPIVFVHGNPTYSLLWRNITPAVADAGRAVAVDLIGMGLSAKPELAYTFADHLQYFSAFMDKVAPQQFSLVLHDWGGPLGLSYALANPDRVKRIALMETFVAPLDWSRFSPMNRLLFRLFRFRPTGYLLNQVFNMFVKKILPNLVKPGYTMPESLRLAYEYPYPTVSSRRPAAMWPEELPLSPRDSAWSALAQIQRELPELDVPTLLLYGEPGALVGKDDVDALLARLPKGAEAVNVGPGLHYLLEAQPQAIGEALRSFFAQDQ